MNKNTGRDRRYLITKNSILMLVMLVIIFMAVWAWFVADNSTADAGGLHMKAQKSNDVQIALPYKGSYPLDNDPVDFRFKESIDFEQSQFFVDDLFSDVTSDGINFIIPTFEVDKNNTRDGRVVIPDGEWTPAVSSKDVKTDASTDNDDKFDYVAMDFYIRSPGNSIKVDGTSFLASLSEINGYPLQGNSSSEVQRSCGNLYGLGKFSADSIVGAMRMSLVAQKVVGQTTSGSGESETRTDTFATGSSPALKFLWLPRPDICLYTGTNTNDSTDYWRVDTDLTPNDTAYVNKTFRHSFYMYNDANVGRGVSKHTYYDNAIADSISNAQSKASYKESPAETPSVFHVSKGSGTYCTTLGQDCSMDFTSGDQVHFSDGDYYVIKFTLNIWIEGEDAEARRAMGSGKFALNLDFG